MKGKFPWTWSQEEFASQPVWRNVHEGCSVEEVAGLPAISLIMGGWENPLISFNFIHGLL